MNSAKTQRQAKKDVEEVIDSKWTRTQVMNSYKCEIKEDHFLLQLEQKEFS